MASFPLRPALWKHRNLHHEVDTAALKNSMVTVGTPWDTLLLMIIFYVYWLFYLWLPAKSVLSVLLWFGRMKKNHSVGSILWFTTRNGRNWMLYLPLNTPDASATSIRNKTSLSLSRESQKHQSSPAAGSFRANGSDHSVIEH